MIESGDLFRFTFDANAGSGFALQSPVLVNSATITPVDFLVVVNSTAKTITFTKKLLNAPLLAAGMDEASWHGARCPMPR